MILQVWFYPIYRLEKLTWQWGPAHYEQLSALFLSEAPGWFSDILFITNASELHTALSLVVATEAIFSCVEHTLWQLKIKKK